MTHPVSRSAPPAEYWIALGKAIRTTLEQRRGAALAGIDSARSRTPPEMTPVSVGDSDYGDEVPIMRSGVVAGCIIREGKSVRVESCESDGSHRVLGYYERAQTSTFPRKVCEIDDIFDAWRQAKIGDGSEVKVIWRVGSQSRRSESNLERTRAAVRCGRRRCPDRLRLQDQADVRPLGGCVSFSSRSVDIVRSSRRQQAE